MVMTETSPFLFLYWFYLRPVNKENVDGCGPQKFMQPWFSAHIHDVVHPGQGVSPVPSIHSSPLQNVSDSDTAGWMSFLTIRDMRNGLGI